MQFAVEILKVRHIIVCGHYGCGGVGAVFRRDRLGLSGNWIRHVEDVREKYKGLLAAAGNEVEACNRLCELNVIEQVANVCSSPIARDAWKNSQELSVHGWIYDISDGSLKDPGFTVSSDQQMMPAYEIAVTNIAGRHET